MMMLVFSVMSMVLLILARIFSSLIMMVFLFLSLPDVRLCLLAKSVRLM